MPDEVDRGRKQAERARAMHRKRGGCMATEMTGAEILVKSLQDLGVTQAFGYAGAAILPVFHALARASINITVNANEQSCAFSAAGYSRSGDRVGVAVVTSGPAITNTLTAVADSSAAEMLIRPLTSTMAGGGDQRI